MFQFLLKKLQSTLKKDHPLKKADLLTASLVALKGSVFGSPREANAALWIADLIVDPEIPAKRRLYTAVDVATNHHSVVSEMGIKVFNQLCGNQSGIRAKFRLRAARRLLRDAGQYGGQNAVTAAQQQVAILSKVMQRTPVDKLASYPLASVKGFLETVECVPGPTPTLPRHPKLDPALKL